MLSEELSPDLGAVRTTARNNICREVGRVICQRMASFEMNVPSREHIERWLDERLLRDDLTCDELGLVLEAVKNHTTVNDYQLQQVFRLEEYNIDTVPSESVAEFAFYMISATVPTGIIHSFLQQVIEESDNSASADTILQEWDTMFALASGNGAECHVRYIGECRLPCNTPERRFKSNFGASPSRAVTRFMDFLERHIPAEELFEHIKLYEFTGARLHSGSTRKDSDLVEEALIAAFDTRLLLNAQTGGYYLNWRANDQQRQVFAELETRFYDTMALHARFPDDNFDEWTTILRGLCAERSNAVEMVTQQARRVTVAGSTIAVIIGHDATKTVLSNPVPFFGDDSRSAMTTRIMLNTLINVERGTRNVLPSDSQYYLPFIDLRPLGSDIGSIDQNIAQLVTYLHVTRPLISITISALVSACARSNFCHAYGLPRAGYLGHVGVATIQHYAGRTFFDDPVSDSPQRGYKTIVIPHLHPGIEKYGRRPRCLSAVLYYSWAITFFWMHTAQRLVLSLAPDQEHDDICEVLYSLCAVDSPELTEQARHLYQELEHAKHELSLYWNRRRTRDMGVPVQGCSAAVVAAAESEARSLGAIQRMQAPGRAQGRPNSTERQQQVFLLWKKQYPDLFVHIPSSERDSWFAWANGVPEGRLFSLSALAHQSHICARNSERHPMHKLIKDFGPDGAHDDTWMGDEEKVRAALSRRSRYMLGNRQGAALVEYMRQLSETRWDRDRLPFHGVLEGTAQKITRNGSLVLRWADDTAVGRPSRDIVLEMRCFEWVPSELRGIPDAFKLRFLPTGIGLQDSDGLYVTRSGRHQGECAALVREESGFGLHRYAADLERLWRCERARLTGGAQLLQPDVPRRLDGRPALMCGQDPSDFQLPVRPSDAVYLLQQWIASEYPHSGGIVTTLNPYNTYTLRSPLPDTGSFARFITASKESHPSARFWLKLVGSLGQTKNASEILRLNIQAVRRDVRVERKQTRLRGTRAGVDYRVIHFGYPRD